MKQIFAIALLLSASFVVAQTKWTIDKSHTNIRFTSTHMVISEVDGEFNEFEGTVVSDGDDFAGSKVEFVTQVASIDTKNERRDNHLRSEDFFYAEEYPELRFNGEIVKEGEEYFLVGKLTMRGVTRDEKFNVKYNGTVPARRGRKAGLKVTGAINRFDYGLKWNNTIETGGLVVGEEIGITCNVELNEVTES